MLNQAGQNGSNGVGLAFVFVRPVFEYANARYKKKARTFHFVYLCSKKLYFAHKTCVICLISHKMSFIPQFYISVHIAQMFFLNK